VRHIVQTGSAISHELLLMGDAARQIGRDLGTAVSALVQQAFDPYRPELHYMRGPGPKWREQHGLAEARRAGGRR